MEGCSNVCGSFRLSGKMDYLVVSIVYGNLGLWNGFDWDKVKKNVFIKWEMLVFFWDLRFGVRIMVFKI